jgi:hypothetical protein
MFDSKLSFFAVRMSPAARRRPVSGNVGGVPQRVKRSRGDAAARTGVADRSRIEWSDENRRAAQLVLPSKNRSPNRIARRDENRRGRSGGPATGHARCTASFLA